MFRRIYYPNMLTHMILWGFFVSVTAAAKISGIFNGITSIEYIPGNNFPSKVPTNPSWYPTVTWQVDGAVAKPGDTFSLMMPCVFRFPTTEKTIELLADNVVIATCSIYGGELVVPYGSLSCVISTNIKSWGWYSGSIKFPVTFNIGGYTSDQLACASMFSSGPGNIKNTVTFYDGDNAISGTADFEDQVWTFDPKEVYYASKLVASRMGYANSVMAGDCPNGYESGTLGFEMPGGGADCNSAIQGYAKAFNTWLLPLGLTESSFQVSCNENLFTIKYSNIPAGYRPYAYIFQRMDLQATGLRTVTFLNTFKCNGQNEVTFDKPTQWALPADGSIDSNGALAVELITSTWTGTTTSVTTLPFTTGGTRTIEVLVPIPVTTTTGTWTGSTKCTTTLTATVGGTKTVQIWETIPATTTTITWTGTLYTTTLPFTTGGTKTIKVYTPCPSIPITTTTGTWTGATKYTTTLPFTSGGTKTIQIWETIPATTTTITWTGTLYTTTLPFTTGGTKTIKVYTPCPSIPITTTTGTWTGATKYTTTLPFTSGGTKTIQIWETIPATTTTITWTGTLYTTTLPFTTGGTKTIEVYTPCPSIEVTTTSIPCSGNGYTSTLPLNGGSIRTVQVCFPQSSSKVYWNSSSTIVDSDILSSKITSETPSTKKDEPKSTSDTNWFSVSSTSSKSETPEPTRINSSSKSCGDCVSETKSTESISESTKQSVIIPDTSKPHTPDTKTSGENIPSSKPGGNIPDTSKPNAPDTTTTSENIPSTKPGGNIPDTSKPNVPDTTTTGGNIPNTKPGGSIPDTSKPNVPDTTTTVGNIPNTKPGGNIPDIVKPHPPDTTTDVRVPDKTTAGENVPNKTVPGENNPNTTIQPTNNTYKPTGHTEDNHEPSLEITTHKSITISSGPSSPTISIYEDSGAQMIGAMRYWVYMFILLI